MPILEPNFHPYKEKIDLELKHTLLTLADYLCVVKVPFIRNRVVIT